MIGTCALCQAEGVTLRDSHILPKWCYRKIRGEGPGNPNPVMISGGRAFPTSRQIKKHLLCPICEQRVGVWENYVSQLVAQPDGAQPMYQFLDGGGSLVPGEDARVVAAQGLDWSKIFRFAVSVVWRADMIEGSTDLGEKYREVARAFLLGEDDHPTGIHVVQHVHVQGRSLPRLDRSFATPTMHRQGGCRVHMFLMCGLEYWVVVGRLPEADLQDLCIGCSDQKRVFLQRARASASVALFLKAARQVIRA